MALSDKFTRSQIRSALRRELMDPNGRWWGDSELNGYIDRWQDRVNAQLEFIWGSATTTHTNTATVGTSAIASDIERIDQIYFNDRRLVFKSKEELELLDRDWRGFATTTSPPVVYEDDIENLAFWPPATGTYTLATYYVKELSFAADTSTQALPAWTRYSAIPYCAFRAFNRRGPNHNTNKALRYKRIFDDQLQRYGVRKRNFFPKRSYALKPGDPYAADIVDPFFPVTEITLPSNVVTTLFADETPGGAVNGANTAFTLSNTPNPTSSLELELGGSTLKQDVHYTLTGTDIDMSAGTSPVGAPQSTETLFARYRYTS